MNDNAERARRVGGRGRPQGVRVRGGVVGRGGRGGRGQGRQGRVRGQRREARRAVSDEIRATLIDHVINHGLTMREAGLRVQPNLS